MERLTGSLSVPWLRWFVRLICEGALKTKQQIRVIGLSKNDSPRHRSLEIKRRVCHDITQAISPVF
jgi:hypothetical protein